MNLDQTVNISSLFSKDRANHYLYDNESLLECPTQESINSNALRELVHRMYDVYKNDPKLFKQVFEDMDSKGEGVLDQKQMCQAFALLGVKLTNDEWLLLAKYYFREVEYLNNKLQKPLVFSYQVFLKDVEKVPTKIHENYHIYRTNEKNRELYDMILKIIYINVYIYIFFYINNVYILFYKKTELIIHNKFFCLFHFIFYFI